MDADGANLTRLTTSDTFDGEASWSPDGQQIAFASFRTGNLEVFVMDTDGSQPDEPHERLRVRQRARLVAGRRVHRVRHGP